MFEFIFRMLAEGEVALPAKGMGAIPTQIAGRLPEDSIRLGAKVDSWRDQDVRRALLQLLIQKARVHVPGFPVRVDEDGSRPEVGHDVRAGRKREGGDQNLVPRADAQHQERQVEGCRPAGEGRCMGYLYDFAELPLEAEGLADPFHHLDFGRRHLPVLPD